MVASPAPPVTETPTEDQEQDQEHLLSLNDLVTPQAVEADALTLVQQFLRQQSTRLELVGLSSDGEKEAVELPASALAALRLLISHLAQGDTVKLVPIRKEMSTYEAAALLNVSHQYLMRLLEQGDIPYQQVGVHRRIRFLDVMAYKQRRDAGRAKHLQRMIRLCEEAGAYEKTLTPPANWQRLDPDSIVPPTEE